MIRCASCGAELSRKEWDDLNCVLVFYDLPIPPRLPACQDCLIGFLVNSALTLNTEGTHPDAPYEVFR